MREKVKKIMYVAFVILMVGMLTVLFTACSSQDIEVMKEDTDVSDSDVTSTDASNIQYVSLTEGAIEGKVVDEQSAKQALESISQSLGISDVETELEVENIDKIDDDSYYRMQQYYEGIPVFGRNIALSTDEEGNVTALTANSSKIENVDTTPKVTQEDVDTSVKKYFDDNDAVVEVLSEDKLYIYSLNLNEAPRLSYSLSVVTTEGAFDVLIDAKTGEIIKFYDAIRYEQMEFECDGQKETQKFIAETSGNLNSMTYVSETGTKINVYTPKSSSKYTWYEDGAANLVTWKTGKKADTSAVDAMANMQKAYTFFEEIFQRDSFDGKKTDINVYVHVTGYQKYDGTVKKTLNNAFHWYSPNGTVFAFTKKYNGLFKDSEYSAELDVVAHEYMHGVESSISGMNYEGESGAIMEAYSDIFGELVEDYSNNGILDGDCNWALIDRDFIEPSSNGYPDTYMGKNWASTSDLQSDNGGVHTNNTVLTHAMYLMWNGINGDTNKEISTNEIAELWYRALHLLQSDATFSQCANAVIVVAQQMEQNGKLSAEQMSCVKKAFEEVGINTDMTKTRTVANGTTIFVMNEDMEAYDDYHLVIEKEESIVVEEDITDKNGYVLDLAAGTYTVKVTDNAVKGSENEFSLTIKVIEVNDNSTLKNVVHLYTDFREKIYASDFTIQSEQIITLGELGVIEPEIYPSGAENYQITWSSSDEKVATVTASGESCVITTHSKGTTTITATLVSGENTITKTTNLRVASKGRDTVLVLDISGSMSGIPMMEMKEAAIDFCQELLLDEYNNRVGIVFYDDEIITIPLTDDLNSLVSYIEQVNDGGTTNMEAGIATAKDMLEQQGKADSIKNIVIMADGLPNDGKTSNSGSMTTITSASDGQIAYANAVIDTAKEAMNLYNMYSLGFFHDLSEDGLTFAVEFMKELTNQADGYHQVEEAERLQFAFGDISEEISDGSKIVINIACPVDVAVTYKGETLSSAVASYNDKTSFGTLQLLGTNQDIKVLSLEPDIDYDIQLTGTGNGVMNYSVNYMNENEEVTDSREFRSVPITPTTKIVSRTNVATEDMALNIDEDGDGEVDTIWTAAKNDIGSITYEKNPKSEEEQEVIETEPQQEPEQENEKENFDVEAWKIALIVIGVLGFAGIAVATVLICMSKRSKMVEDNPEAECESDEKEGDILPREEQPTEDKEPVFEPSISILNGPLAGAEIPIRDKEIIYIGKDSRRANVVFSGDYPNVSRLHCSIMYDAKYQKYYVTDSSSNGTYYLNNIRLEKGKRTAVSPGTVLILANDNAKIMLR